MKPFGILTIIILMTTGCLTYDYVDGSTFPSNKDLVGKKIIISGESYILACQDYSEDKVRGDISYYAVKPYKASGREYLSREPIQIGTVIKIVRILEATNYRIFGVHRQAVVEFPNGEFKYDHPIYLSFVMMEKFPNHFKYTE